MAPRIKMNDELIAINDKIEVITGRVQDDVKKAVQSIVDRDGDLARSIIDGGDDVDDMEDEINEACFRFLATQAPVARDLRYCISIMKMVRDIERIGDHSEDLAKFTLRLVGHDDPKELIDIPRMADMSTGMVHNAIKAFINRDLRLARKVWKADEEVDELYRTIYEEEIALADQISTDTEACIMFAFIAAHLERVADYATNICEEAVFYLEGEYMMED